MLLNPGSGYGAIARHCHCGVWRRYVAVDWSPG